MSSLPPSPHEGGGGHQERRHRESRAVLTTGGGGRTLLEEGGAPTTDMQMDVRDMSKFSDESFDCAPVPLAQFDDTQLLSYYNLLEETSLVRESAHRILSDFGNNFGRNFEGRPDAKLLPSLVALRKAAERRSVWLFFLPRGMTRRAQNRSRHDNRWQ
ncbi:hypothetical protein ZWY2020_005370 [Hordeum vulgare]|nr:hypothetical protein ZWY2020_005370 [Hordeum vulgare]